MNREYHHWYSPRLGRDMEFLVFGHAGAKVLVFPTRDGRFYEYENLRIVETLQHKIEAGHLQLFCVDSIDHESFYCFWSQPKDRIQRHMQFEEYILNEVMPFMEAKNPHPCTIVHGCSLGAYHAANMAFRHPQRFQKLVAFSGRFDLTLEVEHFKDLFNGYYDDNIYFHTPSHFLPNLTDQNQLNQISRMDITLVIGKEDPFLHNNREFSHILNQKGIRHGYYEWDSRAHQGYYWRQMARLYI
ncbi:MAG: alpha/beta hydrolase-fold protein [Methylomonas sp.]|jgi:esterase/lipase superfamily enzyme|uniref:esterase family protein n=1 Tax=Methylomonas sp. TaxID=418 RepID=UPI0025E63B3E|nr:alpha/beta hydrolase-fold protein [Methylomonas sp.]MCK9605016.1 alpha/beta hydrolase-fold protein [Methylomonas sp.]